MVTLESERLRFRPFSMDDVDALHEVQRDDDSMRFYGGGFDRGRTQDWIERSIACFEKNGYKVLHLKH